MSEVLERLLRDKSSSDAKSYLIGLERGRIWAEDHADYFEMREWSEQEAGEFDDLILPHQEERQFRLLRSETPLEWTSYLKGWLEGVREVVKRY
ncbi:MAG: hypothetical protein AB1529_07490 [Candidatus Micrarchaeota archaeon]